MSEVWVVLSWWIIVQALGLAARPLAFRLLRWLPDRGYMLSKPLGLLFVSYFFWLLEHRWLGHHLRNCLCAGVPGLGALSRACARYYHWLRSIGSRGPFWFISDEGDLDTADENRQAETWMTEHACRVDSHNAGSARVSRFIVPLNATGSFQANGAIFNEEIELNGFQLSQSVLKPGDGLCVELKWQALKQPSADDTVFVHVINAAGQLVTQNDMQPQSGFAPTSQWQVSATIIDQHGVILPANLPAGEYTFRVGLYRSDNQAPVPVTHGDAVLPNAIVLAQITIAP